MNLIAALMKSRLGARVRAPESIFYATHGVEIAPGELGRVRSVTCAGAVVDVEWESFPGLELRTSFDSLEVLDDA